jgi:hypothetical protein
MNAPASHTRKSAYNAAMAAVDELARVQIHAMSSGQPLELSDAEKGQLRLALEAARELARVMERAGNLSD